MLQTKRKVNFFPSIQPLPKPIRMRKAKRVNRSEQKINHLIKKIHSERVRNWRNMMVKGTPRANLRPRTRGPKFQNQSHNDSLNRTMVGFGKVGSDRHNSFLRNSINSYNRTLEQKKKKMFESIFYG